MNSCINYFCLKPEGQVDIYVKEEGTFGFFAVLPRFNLIQRQLLIVSVFCIFSHVLTLSISVIIEQYCFCISERLDRPDASNLIRHLINSALSSALQLVRVSDCSVVDSSLAAAAKKAHLYLKTTNCTYDFVKFWCHPNNKLLQHCTIYGKLGSRIAQK